MQKRRVKKKKVKDGKEETKTEENEGDKYFLMHAYSRMNASKTTQIIIPHTHSHRCSRTHTHKQKEWEKTYVHKHTTHSLSCVIKWEIKFFWWKTCHPFPSSPHLIYSLVYQIFVSLAQKNESHTSVCHRDSSIIMAAWVRSKRVNLWDTGQSGNR